MTTNQHFQKAPEHKQIQWTQSWYEPVLRTLDLMLDERRANLRKINRDEKNAMVLQQELLETLINNHTLTLWQAGEVIVSLLRAGKISKYGRFIQMNEKAGDV